MAVVLAEVTRGELVESVHHGIVVAVGVDGHVIATAGDPETRAYFRSSAKPFQAVPLVESGAADRFGFTEAELAICCSSHDAMPWQQEMVRGMLAKLGLGPDALRCGVAPPYDSAEAARVTLGVVPPSPVQCDCSGKHTGMLATCLHLGFPIESYLQADHPLQQQILEVIAQGLRTDPGAILLAPDGCSLPTFGAPLRCFAAAYATLAAPHDAPERAGRDHAPALERLRSVMAAHPRHIAGPGELDTDLMEVTRGRIVAKLGAEGLLCLAAPERGLGIAIRILDGSERARSVVALAALEQLDLLDRSEREELARRQSPSVTNFNGWTVGEMRPAFELRSPS
jgi:L-asparaginase II